MTTAISAVLSGRSAVAADPTDERVEPLSAVLGRARRGDRAATAALLNRLQDRWYRFCLSMLRDEHAARDAMQESAVRLLGQLEQFRGEAKVETYAIGIALNVCREMRRKAQPALAAPRDSADPAASPAEQVDARDRSALMRRLIDQLPDRQREAVVLRYFEQLNTTQTAEAMGCAEGTVKATLAAGLRSLRTKWHGET